MSPPGFNRRHAGEWCLIFASVNLLNAVSIETAWIAACCYLSAAYCFVVGVQHLVAHFTR